MRIPTPLSFRSEFPIRSVGEELQHFRAGDRVWKKSGDRVRKIRRPCVKKFSSSFLFALEKKTVRIIIEEKKHFPGNAAVRFIFPSYISYIL